MKVCMISNFLNHHQLPFCQAMKNLIGDNFRFIATTATPMERLSMGYEEMNEVYSFVLPAYKSKTFEAKALKLSREADIIIIGSAPNFYYKERMKVNKITFRYEERSYKKGIHYAYTPRRLASLVKHHLIYFHKPNYILCASGYTASDYAMNGLYLGKTYKWGYFPKKSIYTFTELMKFKDNKKPVILWAGRLMPWKHPEEIIYVADYLKNRGYDFFVQIIGDGELKDEMSRMIKKMGLEAQVKLLGAMPYESVRNYMEHANIFAFTSDYEEGWGAVLNESMSSGCVAVVSHAVGAAPFLVKHKNNGIIYKSKDLKNLCKAIEDLLNKPEQMNSLAQNAYKTIDELWNAEVAAQRLLLLGARLKSGGKYISIFNDGPCSVAPAIPQWRMYKTLTKK